jgi:2-dehydro-3-deoxyphosphogluconate aldolase/(4S)-4-hydroxy-2-oxoglutarate aldolase
MRHSPESPLDLRESPITRAIEACGVVAVIRMKEPDKLRAVVDALAAGGLRALEITMTVPRAIELIAEIRPTLPAGFILGAGTVTDGDTARRAVEAGAEFLVSPVFRPEVISVGHANGVPVMPGCFTPTEILGAWEAGADVVKVFPATALGPGFLKDIRGPLPHVKLMPTGGVTIDNAGDWIRAGAVAVGVGSALLDAKAIASGVLGPITDNARRIVDNVRAARGTS